MINQEYWQEAKAWASDVFRQISDAMSSPDKKIDGETLRIYEELKDFGWFELHPLKENAASTIYHLAIVKYGKIKWHKEREPKNKPPTSKWQKVAQTKPRR